MSTIEQNEPGMAPINPEATEQGEADIIHLDDHRATTPETGSVQRREAIERARQMYLDAAETTRRPGKREEYLALAEKVGQIEAEAAALEEDPDITGSQPIQGSEGSV